MGASIVNYPVSFFLVNVVKTRPAHKSAPAEWIADLKESISDLEAGRLVDSEVIFAELDEAIAQIKAGPYWISYHHRVGQPGSRAEISCDEFFDVEDD